jgi:multidrug transporter EmrE-like cation transporter
MRCSAKLTAGFGQRTSAREALGMALVVAGVALLILAY